MANEQNMTGRSSYDPTRTQDLRPASGHTGKILLAAAALLIVIGAILWSGAGGDGTSTAPDLAAPPAIAPADPTAPTADPAAPAPDDAAPLTDPVATPEAPAATPAPAAPAQ